MKISIFGLGYVGCVSLGCLAKSGHVVIGIDTNKDKIDLINHGQSTIVEEGIDELIKKQWELNRIIATTDPKVAIAESNVSILCVGTPPTADGHLSMAQVFNCASQIGDCLKSKNGFHIVVIRSTVMPGTNMEVGKIIEKLSGKKRNVDFAVISNPEFLREGSAISDYYNPSLTVIGSDNEQAIQILLGVYSDIPAPVVKVDIKVAELIKYVNNSFHALKICFANEVASICNNLDIDPFELMDLFCRDSKLNISTAYLKPGFAYGGSCLPKDLNALNAISHDNYIKTPVLASIENSNSNHLKLALNKILELNKSKIGFIGMSFKDGTDDLRFSPAVELIELLIGKGKKILIYDSNVSLSKIVGANKSYIEDKLPHISSLMINEAKEVIEYSEIIVFPNRNSNIARSDIADEKNIVDLFGNKQLMDHPKYFGICW